MPSKEPQPAQTEPTPELVVVEPFPGHARGDLIVDPVKVSDILAGPWSAHVVQRAAA